MPSKKSTKKPSISSAGGPKSPEGKAKSSQNAVKLGANSMRPTTLSEQQMVDDFVLELTRYYDPQSPLEKLQIQRIAICRAKLARLYEVERVRLELAQKAIRDEPDHAFNEMGIPKGFVRSMAQEGLRRSGTITLPLGLMLNTLEAIAQEVDQFHGALSSEREFVANFPVLARFLKQYPATGLDHPDSMFERLEVVLRRLRWIMRQTVYFGPLADVIEELFNPKPAPNTLDTEAEELLMKIQPGYVPPQPVKPTINLQQLQILMQLFVQLKYAYDQAQRIVAQHQEMQMLLAQSAMLPSADSELLTRYQTLWERRLSSLMGEFLELQKHR